MNKRLAALAATLSAALLLVPTTAQAQGGQPQLRAVFGGIVTAESPVLPIGSKLPTELPGLQAAAKDAPPPLPTLTDEEEQRFRVTPTKPAPKPEGLTAGPTGETAVESFPYVSVAWCRNNYGGSSGATYVDRFNWCAVRPSVIYSINSEGQVTGTTTFRMITAGKGAKGKSGTIDGRRTYFTSQFDQFVDAGQVTNPATTDLEITYTTSGYSGPMGSNPLCDVAGNSPQKVLDWKLGSMAEFTISSLASAGYTPDKISRCGVAQWARSDLNPTWLQLQRTNVRQDSAPYLGTGGASAFQDVMAVFWKYSWASPTHGQVAKHIWDAQTAPASTYPYKAGKAVPGSIDSGKPLSRLANQTVWDAEANARRAETTRVRTAACEAITPRPPDGWQCDEYPFASTWEGAGLGDGNYSVRYVEASHNLEAGTMLGQWYLDERVLHREYFYTEIAP